MRALLRSLLLCGLWIALLLALEVRWPIGASAAGTDAEPSGERQAAALALARISTPLAPTTILSGTPATISGVVTSSNPAARLNPVRVTASAVAGETFYVAETDASRAYTLTIGAPGAYRIKFEETWPSEGLPFTHFDEYYDDKATEAAATEVVVTAGQVLTGINATLQLGGQIRGTITSDETGEVLQGVGVMAFDAQGQRIADVFSRIVTEPDGDRIGFVVAPLVAGTYRVKLDPLFLGTVDRFYSEWYNHELSLSTATPVSVTLGEITRVDASLRSRRRIESLATSPSLPDVLLVGYAPWYPPEYSLDGGATWQGFPAEPWNASLQPGALAVAQRVESGSKIRFMVAAGDTLYRTGDFGATWASFTFPSALPCTDTTSSISHAVTAPTSPVRIYVLALCDYFVTAPEPMWMAAYHGFVSDDAGVSWRLLGDMQSIVPSPVVNGRLYAEWSGVWRRSDDFGATWSDLAAPSYVRLALDAQESATIYTLTYMGDLDAGYTSRDGGATWTRWQSPCPTEGEQLVADNERAGTLYVECGSPAVGLHRSEDYGATWVQLSDLRGYLLQPDGGRAGHLLRVTEDVLWRSWDQGETWASLLSYPKSAALQNAALYLPGIRR